MLNYLKADFYRLTKSVGFYVSLVFLFICVLITSLTMPMLAPLSMMPDNNGFIAVLAEELTEKDAGKFIRSLGEDNGGGIMLTGSSNAIQVFSTLESIYNNHANGFMPDDMPLEIIEKEKTLLKNINISKEDIDKFSAPLGETGNFISYSPSNQELEEYEKIREQIAKKYITNMSDEDAYILMCGRIYTTEYEDSDGTAFTIKSNTDLIAQYFMLGKVSPKIALLKAFYGSSFFMYFVLAIVSMLTMAEYKNHTFKNSLSQGFPRGMVYFEKFLGSVILCAVYWVAYLILSYLFAIVNGGSLGIPSSLPLSLMLHGLLTVGLCAFANALVFIFKRGAIVNALYIIYFFFQAIIVSILSIIPVISKAYPTIGKFDYSFQVSQTVASSLLETNDITRLIIMPLIYICLFTVLGFSVFKKSEIK